MRRVILGTAGHIDHGKTALVHALTGVDTDRLKEEKERGITIDLGFAELVEDPEVVLGVVDVPGHEDFVRTMVAGASGMDVVLLAVAADEGVMPQTREHLAVVQLLDVPEMVVALTKTDLVEEAWLELVEDEVRETLAPGPWGEVAVVPTSSRTGEGMAALRAALLEAARRSRARRVDDLLRLPVDRSFTVPGTGTVVTGTLWSGRLHASQAVRLLPGGTEARVRSIQHHGRGVESAEAGARTAVALAGSEVDRESVKRGVTLVDPSAPWAASWMLTVRLRVLPDTGWRLEHNQRVHLHLGTQEVLARTALLEEDVLEGGGEGWVQLRLEEPVVARARDRLVIRSYSPVTTMAGAEVAEPDPPKRKGLEPVTRTRLEAVLDGPPTEAVEAALELASWAGLSPDSVPLATGLALAEAAEARSELRDRGGEEAQGRVWAPGVASQADARILEELHRGHREHPLRPTVPLARLRQALPDWTAGGLADARLDSLASRGRLTILESGARLAGWEVRLTPDQEAAAAKLEAAYAEAGLQPPEPDALPEGLRSRSDRDDLLRHLAEEGTLVALDDVFWIHREALDGAVDSVRSHLRGREGLGPADFREALPVTRKHLLPLLGWMDLAGITLRGPDGRAVLPEDG